MKKLFILIVLFVYSNIYAGRLSKLFFEEKLYIDGQKYILKVYTNNNFFNNILEFKIGKNIKKIFKDRFLISYDIYDFDRDNNSELVLMFAKGKGDLVDIYVFNFVNKKVNKLLAIDDIFKGSYDIKDNKLELFIGAPNFNFLSPYFFIKQIFKLEKGKFIKVDTKYVVGNSINSKLNYAAYLKSIKKYNRALKMFKKCLNLVDKKDKKLRKKIYFEIISLMLEKYDYYEVKKLNSRLKKEFNDKDFFEKINSMIYFINDITKQNVEFFKKRQIAIQYFEKEEYDKAAKIYINIKDSFDSKKYRADINYKLALCYYNLKKYKLAKKIFKEIIRNYKSCDEAKWSKEFLDEIRSKK